MVAPRCRLYLITPPRLDATRFPGLLTAALDGGDIACVQLRLPGADDATVETAVRALRPPCHERGIAFVIDGRADLAAALGADGVHLGDAACVGDARRLLGDDAIVGVSCGGSRHAAIEAATAGADYVSFGALFPSPTLPEANLVAPDILAWWSELMEVACVATGGITSANLTSPVAAGADFLAVSSAVWNDPAGPGTAVAELNSAIERVLARDAESGVESRGAS